MIQFLVTILVASIFGSQFQVSDAQAQLTTVIRIQSTLDLSFMGIPLTPLTVPIEPVFPGTGGKIVYWKVSWANSLKDTGTVIVASDVATREYRCLNSTIDTVIVPDAETLVVTSQEALPTGSGGPLFWKFIPTFVSGTYKYKIMAKGTPTEQCLKRSGAVFELADCGASKNFLFNLLS